MQGNKITQRIKGLPPVAYMLVVLIVIFSVMSPNYLTLMNFKDMLIQVTPLMIIAFGQTRIILTQGTDLSLGTQISFVTVFTVWMALWEIPLPATILLTILSTTLIGVVNGVIVAEGSVPPFIATYGMQSILNSLSLLLATSSSIYSQSFIYRIVVETIILGIPLMIWTAILVFIIVWMVLNKTRSGTNIHGLGGNREALQLAGINPIICLIKTYVLAGFIAEIAGVITLNRTKAGMPMTATGWGFQAVVVTFLGGTFLRERRGSVIGTIFGVLLIQVVRNGLNIVGVQSVKQSAIIGSIILIAIVIGAVVRTRSKGQGGRDTKAKRIFEKIGNSKVFCSLIGLIILIIFSAITMPNFRTVDNIITVFRQASVLLALSAELTAVLLTDGMDLSVGTTAGFIGYICAQRIKGGVPIPAAFILGILIGLVVGVINGLLTGILPNFIATYGTNWVMSGLAVLVMQRAVIYDLPKGFIQIGAGRTGPVSNLVIIAAVIVALIYVLLQKTTYGRQVYAYSSNPTATKYAVVPIKKIMLSIFTMCSMYAGLAGMLMAARLNAADAAMEDSYGLQTVAAVVVGGISMLRGEGDVLGAVVGALMLTIIINIINLKGVSSYAQELVIGIVIIAMVPFSTCSKRKQESKAT